MNPHHRRFELQCVLASCGQLSGRQLEKFEEHAAACDACKKHLREMAELNLRLWTSMPSRPTSPIPRNMTERFVLRAMREGVPLNQKPVHRSMHLALALPAIIVMGIMTAVVAWRGDAKQSPDIASHSAPPITVNQSSVRAGGLPVADETATLRDHIATQRIIPRGSFGTRKSSVRIQSNGPSHFAFVFRNGHPLESLRSGDRASGAKLPAPGEMAPALAEWLARESPPPAWAPLSYRRNCDPRGEAVLGDHRWSAWERSNVSAPPVFCFDPRIALVADSKLPESVRPHWNLPQGGLPSFFVTPGPPAIAH